MLDKPSIEEVKNKILSLDFDELTEDEHESLTDFIIKNKELNKHLEYFLEKGLDWTTINFIKSLSINNFKAAKRFIEYSNGQILAPEMWYFHPIVVAINNDDIEQIKFLIKHIRNDYLRDIIKPAILTAKKQENEEILKYLYKIKEKVDL